MKTLEKNRREFLKALGIGSMALAAYPPLSHMLATSAKADDDDDDGSIGYHFVAMSDAGEDDQGINRMLATGSGRFNDNRAKGGGFYNHFAWAFPAPMAFRELGAGTWKAGKVLNFTMTEPDPGPPEVVNPWGFNLSGILEMEVRLFPANDPSTGIPGKWTVVCNIPPSNAFTGLPEGYFLDVAGLSFAPATFPTGSPFGITSFSVDPGQ